MYRADPAALQRLIEESGVDYKTNRRSYIFTCPKCSKPGKLNMLKTSGRFVCWVCSDSGFKGKPEFALTLLLNIPVREICQALYGGKTLDELAPEGALSLTFRDFFDEDEDFPEEVEEIQKFTRFPLDFYEMGHPFAKRGLDYLVKRGISKELAEAFDLRYCPPQQRVIFPIKKDGKLSGWQARAVFETKYTDSEGNNREVPKILTSGPRDSTLMFHDNMIGSEHAIICEGPVDALKCAFAGGFVATMGKIVSRKQIELVANSGVRKVYLALDPDAASETMKLTQAFDGLEIYRLLPPKGCKDLGECSLEQVWEQFKTAPRVYPGTLFLHFST